MEHTANRLEELGRKPIQGDFNFKRLCETHRRIFQDVYDWAGKPRHAMNIVKYERALAGASVDYADWTEVAVKAEDAIRDMTEKDYSKMSLDEQAEHFSLGLRDIWEIHGFREGNTRASVHFCCDLIESKGIPIKRQLFADNSGYMRNALVAASKTAESYTGKTQHEYLIKIVKDSLMQGLAEREKSIEVDKPKPKQRRTGVEAPASKYEPTPGGTDAPPADQTESDDYYNQK
jgi:cell filamentation protein